MALLGQRAENEFVGVNCGILDQYTSVLGQAGHALLLDCRHLDEPARGASLRTWPWSSATRAPSGSWRPGLRRAARPVRGRRGASCARSTRPSRPCATSARRCSRLTRPSCRRWSRARCRFIVEEEPRVLELAEALPAGDPSPLATLLDASWDGATELFEIGAPAMTAMHEAMRGAPGLIARRQAGAGFGGCLVAFVEQGAVPAFSAHVRRAYATATGIDARVFPVEAAPGAGLLAWSAAAQ